MHFHADILAFLDKTRFNPDTSRYKMPTGLTVARERESRRSTFGSQQMKRMLQKGFTLIELVVVIVILGILAAVAIPQFTDLSAAARTAVGQAACGALQSTAVLLFASNKAASPIGTITAATVVLPATWNAGSTCAVATYQSADVPSVPTTCPAPLPAALCS
jgi:prepilin-type N-terminal cleavage/methylation domain-containing protein